jgi:hypothetical protein
VNHILWEKKASKCRQEKKNHPFKKIYQMEEAQRRREMEQQKNNEMQRHVNEQHWQHHFEMQQVNEVQQ